MVCVDLQKTDSHLLHLLSSNVDPDSCYWLSLAFQKLLITGGRKGKEGDGRTFIIQDMLGTLCEEERSWQRLSPAILVQISAKQIGRAHV